MLDRFRQHIISIIILKPCIWRGICCNSDKEISYISADDLIILVMLVINFNQSLMARICCIVKLRKNAYL
jgi:hypothetical protein